MGRRLIILLCLVFFMGCAKFERQIRIEMSCENCKTPYGSGDVVSVKINTLTNMER